MPEAIAPEKPDYPYSAAMNWQYSLSYRWGPLNPWPWPHWNIDLFTLVQVLCIQPRLLWVHHVLSHLEDTASLHSSAPDTLTPTVSPSSLPQCPLGPLLERVWYRCFPEGWTLHGHLKTLLETYLSWTSWSNMWLWKHAQTCRCQFVCNRKPKSNRRNKPRWWWHQMLVKLWSSGNCCPFWWEDKQNRHVGELGNTFTSVNMSSLWDSVTTIMGKWLEM